jgi:hypothetical protein
VCKYSALDFVSAGCLCHPHLKDFLLDSPPCSSIPTGVGFRQLRNRFSVSRLRPFSLYECSCTFSGRQSLDCFAGNCSQKRNLDFLSKSKNKEGERKNGKGMTMTIASGGEYGVRNIPFTIIEKVGCLIQCCSAYI